MRKILNILTSEWDAKVTTIEEGKGESMKSVAALFKSLSEYKEKLKFKKELIEMDGEKKKGINLNAIKEKEPEEEEEVEDEGMRMNVI